MDKYTKHRFSTALVIVLEIRASLYSTPSDAIFMSKFNERSLFFVRDITHHKTTF